MRSDSETPAGGEEGNGTCRSAAQISGERQMYLRTELTKCFPNNINALVIKTRKLMTQFKKIFPSPLQNALKLKGAVLERN